MNMLVNNKSHTSICKHGLIQVQFTMNTNCKNLYICEYLPEFIEIGQPVNVNTNTIKLVTTCDIPTY